MMNLKGSFSRLALLRTEQVTEASPRKERTSFRTSECIVPRHHVCCAVKSTEDTVCHHSDTGQSMDGKVAVFPSNLDNNSISI